MIFIYYYGQISEKSYVIIVWKFTHSLHLILIKIQQLTNVNISLLLSPNISFVI